MTTEQSDALRGVVCYGHGCYACELGAKRCAENAVEDAELIRMARANFARLGADNKEIVVAYAKRTNIHSLIAKTVVL